MEIDRGISPALEEEEEVKLSIRFVGLSGHIVSGAPGHFETFHRGIFHAFKDLIGEEKCIFLGSESSQGINHWFIPNIPNSFTSTVSWVPKDFLQSYLECPNSDDDNLLLYVYEGNLANLFLLGSIARKRRNVFLYFNLFNSNKYQAVLKSRPKLYIFKKLFSLALRGIESKVYLTGDSKRFAELLSRQLVQNFTEYPIYSALKFKSDTNSPRKRILVNFRGLRSEELFQSAIEGFPKLQSLELDLHGVHDKNIAQRLAKFTNLRFLPDQVDESTYFSLYRDYYRVAFIYDPEFFSMQSSGRLADAIVVGAQIIVPSDTSLEDMLIEYGNGSAFTFTNSESLAHALTHDPQWAQRSDYLPTSASTAQKMLSQVQSLINHEKRMTKPYKRALDGILDGVIRGALYFLRLLFGIKNYLHRFWRRNFGRVAPKFE